MYHLHEVPLDRIAAGRRFCAGSAATEDDDGTSRLYAFAIEPGDNANPRTQTRARAALEGLAQEGTRGAGDALSGAERERLETLGYAGPDAVEFEERDPTLKRLRTLGYLE